MASRKTTDPLEELYAPRTRDGTRWKDDLTRATDDAWRALPRRQARWAPASTLLDVDGDMQSLKAQRWAVVTHEDRRDDVSEALGKLIAHRGEEQGAGVRVLGVPAAATSDDVDRALRLEGGEPVDSRDEPLYVLLVGEPAELYLGMDSVLARTRRIGRLPTTDPSWLSRYAAKVVATESAAPRKVTPMVAHLPGYDSATARGAAVMDEVLSSIADQGAGLAYRRGFAPEPAPLGEAAAAPGAILLSITEGLHAPDQPSDHGRLILDAAPGGTPMTWILEEDCRGPVAPGGVWLAIACWSAGSFARPPYCPFEKLCGSEPPPTPDHDRVAPWVTEVLGRDDGPLAYIGHLDRGWGFAYHDIQDLALPAAQPLKAGLRDLARGRRVGSTLHQIQRAAGAPEERILAGNQRAYDWLHRQDLRSWILLGDPAARITNG